MGSADEKNGNPPDEKDVAPTASFDGSLKGPGSRIGQFRIEQELGRGGMGVVYLAHDTKLKRPVAIKSLPPDVVSNPQIRSRLKREAQLMAALTHPNIATIYEELEEAEGTTYLILEYVPGQTLAERIAGGRLTLAEAMSVAEQIAAALAAAHEHGVIHRDLKPGNIKVTPHGNVKVLDFGLAKAADVHATDARTTLTQIGRVMGTPAYMSPEQAMGEAVDYRTDIWSLGVVVYEMLTGELPFKGETQQATTNSILHQEPQRITTLRRDVPAKLERLILKMMQKEPSNRYDNMTTLVGELKALGRDSMASLTSREKSPSIAVLPFVNMSADKEQEYFCDGMAEELINALTQISNLRVIARTSAFSYKGRDMNVCDIGRELDVKTILEGSVRKAGNRLRITAQLVDTAHGHHIWSERYDRNVGDVFAIQDEITSAIVDKLKPKLLGEEKARLARGKDVDIEAYQLYLRGRFFWNKRTENGIRTAIDYFELAIEQDPSYALAHAGLADCHVLLGYYAYQEPNQAFPKAKSATLEAMNFDDSLAEAYASLGYISTVYEWDWERAEANFKRAIELNPNYATAHHWYAVLLFAAGRFAESIDEIKKAQELDPRSIIINTNVGWPYYFDRRYDDAIEAFQNALLIDERFWYAHWGIGISYFFKGMYEKALTEYRKAKDLYQGRQSQIESHTGITYLYLGKQEKTQQVLRNLLERSRQEYVPPTFIADLFFALGEDDKGFEYLNKAVDARDSMLIWTRLDPLYDSRRSDPRYTALLRKMNLEQ